MAEIGCPVPDQPTARRALRNMRIQGPSSPQSSGCQEFWRVSATRSGCGIMIVTRPSPFDSPQMPSVEPFGLAG